ncbi:TniQ family protein [Pseudomonas protegens]|uniref:TniQ family protein n=1 Tax=Pseudomonas protegens TaxID=380021 RepID=UPI00200F229D|nr:TniQ family protein [Pseudomonas protegens]
MKALNFLPIPLPHESPTSVIKRLCRRNGYSKGSKFIAFHFTPGKTRVCSLLQGSRFERFITSNLDEHLRVQVRSSFYSTGEKSWGPISIGKLQISRRLLRRVGAALCTECVSDGWEHSLKDIYLSSHCPIHNTHYLFTCPKCGKYLTWLNQLTSHCDCGELLKSPTCSWEDALPERRLIEILEAEDQLRFDRVTAILRHLDTDLKTISTTSIQEKFAAAIALVFDDVERATLSLSHVYNIADPLEMEVLLRKLQPVIPLSTATELRCHFDKLPARTTSIPSSIRIPSSLMSDLLRISQEEWSVLRKDKSFKKLLPTHAGRQPYTIEELSKIAEMIKISNRVIGGRRSVEMAINEGNYYDYQEAFAKISVCARHFAYLLKHNAFGKKQIFNSKVYVPKYTIDEFVNTHIQLRKLGSRLKTSAATIHLALRKLSIQYPIFSEWYGPPFFINLEDVPAIETAIQDLPTLKYSLGRFQSRRVCPTSSTPVVPLSQAASFLHVHPRTIVYYRDLGLLAHHKHDLNVIAHEDVLKFHQRFASPSDLGKELNISSKMVTRVLQSLGISPIAGPNVTGTVSQIFDRSKLPPDLAHHVNPYHDDFGLYWLQKKILTVEEAAKSLRITKHDVTQLTRLEIKPKRAPCYQHYSGVSTKELSTLANILKRLTPLSDFLLIRGMTHFSFVRRFTTPQYVKIVKIGNIEYLTQPNLQKLDLLLDEYCSLGEADKILNAPKHTAGKMLSRNKIQPHYLPNYNYKQPLLRIDDIRELAKKRKNWV